MSAILKPSTQGLLNIARQRRRQFPRAYKASRKNVAEQIRGQSKRNGRDRYRRFLANIGQLKHNRG